MTELKSGPFGASRQHPCTSRQERRELAKYRAESKLRNRYQRGTVKYARKNR
jgi:hypothetical protein